MYLVTGYRKIPLNSDLKVLYHEQVEIYSQRKVAYITAWKWHNCTTGVSLRITNSMYKD